jgi:hypothetical protein
MRHRCSTCQDEKSESAFTSSSLKRRSKICRDCKAEYNRRWYDENRLAHMEDVRRNSARYIEEALEVVRKHKSQPCGECGRRFPPVCMDFDHVRGEKVDIVSRLRGYVSMERLLEEIAKCEVVCANCHRVRTTRRVRARRASARRSK